LGRSRVPVIVSLCTVALNLVTNVALVRVMGFRGLALGTSLAMLVNGLALLALLRRRLGGLEGGHLGLTFAKIVIAALVMAAVSAGVERLVAGAMPGREP
jgi:putative peptidoglycan lipid II flippase